MHKIIHILLFAFLILNACSSDTGDVTKTDLEHLIKDAISGDHESNGKLQGLISSKHLGQNDFNQLFIDELKYGDKIYFSVILEYPDPSLNLFAIYDNKLNFYLLDKSLNGYLNSEWIENGQKKYVLLKEQFLTKDVLSIERASIYEVGDKTAWLIYRSPSRFVKDNNLAYQRVESINDDYIVTKITGTGTVMGEIKIDTFFYYASSKKYLSNNKLFENYVNQEINNFMWINTKPQLTDDLSKSTTDTTKKN